MTEMVNIGAGGNLASGVHVRPIGIDDLSHVRYVHARALRARAFTALTAEEIAAFKAFVEQPSYTHQMAEAALRGQLLGAWLGSDLAGTIGWEQGDDIGELAAIDNLFVEPIYLGCGIGRRLLADAERAARRAGCLEFTARAVTPAAGFFKRHGYKPTSTSALPLGNGQTLPVTFLAKQRLREPRRARVLH